MTCGDFSKWAYTLPSNTLCIDKITAYEIHYWVKVHNNCSVRNGSSVQTYISNRTSDREANIIGMLPSVAYCLCIRVWMRNGHGQCSRTYTVQDFKPTTTKRISKIPSTSTVFLPVLLTVIFSIIIFFIIFVIVIRRRRPNLIPLDDAVGALEPAGEPFDSSHSPELESLNNNDYATA